MSPTAVWCWTGCDPDPPDLVILDHMLPGLSGLEILAASAADPAIRQLPVMMLTARGRDRDLAEQRGCRPLSVASRSRTPIFWPAVRELAGA